MCTRRQESALVHSWDTCAPVIGLNEVPIFFTIAAKFRVHICQGDVPSAYVKADLKETIYMKQVSGFEDPGSEGKVWLLRKALYEPRQAGHEWHIVIDAFLRIYGLTPSHGDACLFFMTVNGALLLVCLT